MSRRGLVISNPMAVTYNGLHIKNTNLDRQELRANLLFWDVLDFPKNNLLGIGPDDDTAFLISAGVIQQTTISLNGSFEMGQAALTTYLNAFRYRESQEPGAWSISTGENSLNFPSDQVDDGRGVLVKLFHAIPVPDKEVPLADILEFRTKRRAELIALRHHLEETYQRIIISGDGPLALTTELEKLQQAISDHIKVSRETGFKLRLQDLSADLNLTGFAGTALTSYHLGLPVLESLLAGAASSLSINIGRSLKGRAVSSNPYRYVTSFHQQLFV